MLKSILTGLALIAAPLLAAPAFAEGAPEDLAKIDALLAAKQCEVDHVNVELEDGGGFDLDDVICADGQYDIKLDAAFNVVEQRKE